MCIHVQWSHLYARCAFFILLFFCYFLVFIACVSGQNNICASALCLNMYLIRMNYIVHTISGKGLINFKKQKKKTPSYQYSTNNKICQHKKLKLKKKVVRIYRIKLQMNIKLYDSYYLLYSVHLFYSVRKFNCELNSFC